MRWGGESSIMTCPRCVRSLLRPRTNGNRMSSFIFGIVNSAAFQMKKSENTEPTTVVGESGPP